MSDDPSLRQQQQQQQPKTVDDIQLPTWNNIVKMLDLSTENDWEKIARYFTKYFTLNDIARIKNDQRARAAFSPSEAVLETLRNNLVPISRLYKCFVEYQLIAACNYLEEAFPPEQLYKRPPTSLLQTATATATAINTATNQTPAQTVPIIVQADSHLSNKICDQITSSISPIEHQHQQHQQQQHENVKLVPVSPNRSVSMNICPSSTSSSSSNTLGSVGSSRVGAGNLLTASSSALTTTDSPDLAHQMMSLSARDQDQKAHLVLVGLFETMLPVINDTAQEQGNQINPTTNSLGLFDNAHGLYPTTRRVYGKFELAHIQSRRLSFLKRKFTNIIDYTLELKMIKFKHANLFTAECIYKSSISFGYYLLYKHEEKYQVRTLSELALDIRSHLDPSQFNMIQQLSILRDIAAAFDFLYDRQVDTNRILHGNLNSDNFLVECRGEDQYVAKLFDFTNVIELKDTENNESRIREELYNLGLLVFTVCTWRQMDRAECDQLHANQGRQDMGSYLYDLYSQNGMNRHRNTQTIYNLLRIFYRFTSNDYEIQKGTNNAYDLFSQWLENCRNNRATIAPSRQ